MITKANYITREKFVDDLVLSGLSQVNAEESYDTIMDKLHQYLVEDVKTRVYLPKIGVLYSDIIIGKTDNQPNRVRFRLSCKPHILN